jgi:hypothetical protein
MSILDADNFPKICLKYAFVAVIKFSNNENTKWILMTFTIHAVKLRVPYRKGLLRSVFIPLCEGFHVTVTGGVALILVQ